LLKSLKHLELDPNFYRAQNALLEGWTEAYLGSLEEASREEALSVARELRFELGFLVEEAGV
jgi:hypothetical protein